VSAAEVRVVAEGDDAIGARREAEVSGRHVRTVTVPPGVNSFTVNLPLRKPARAVSPCLPGSCSATGHARAP
jgi:hypothetical protein